MRNKIFIDSLKNIVDSAYFSDNRELWTMSINEATTRSDVLQWIGDHIPELLKERVVRPLFAAWVDSQLSTEEKQDLHIITNPLHERPTIDEGRWYFLCFGAGDPTIVHTPGFDSSYYGKCEVFGVDLETDHVEAYDVVRVTGTAARSVAFHDYAKEMDQRPFYVECSSLQDLETVERWDGYIKKGDMDSVLMEAGCYADGYEDTVELTDISRLRPGSDFSHMVAENNEYCVIKEPCDAYLVAVKESPDRILRWWYDSEESFVSLSDDLKDLIRQDTQREFQTDPYGMIPLQGFDGYWAFFRPESDELVIWPYDSTGLESIEIPYDFDLRSVDKNVQRGIEELKVQGVNEELQAKWRSFAR